MLSEISITLLISDLNLIVNTPGVSQNLLYLSFKMNTQILLL